MGFPDDFWWGTGAPTAAAEGSAPGSDLGAWEDQGRAPRSGPGAGWPANAVDDLALLASAGLVHRRHVFDWARLEPTPGVHDAAAIEAASAVLDAAAAAGVQVWGCLVDGALPGWFSVDEHGFADRRSRTYLWARHVEWVAETFGDRVQGWVPVFEPNRWAARGWIDGSRPPGRRGDAEGFAEALEAVLLATVDAATRLRQDGRPVASAHLALPCFPARTDPEAPPSPDAEVLAGTVDDAHTGCWLRLLDQGTLVVPGRAPVEVPEARRAFDVIGFTYRHAVAVRGDGALLPYPQALPTGPDGQVAWAEGLALSLHRLADALPGRPLLVAGCGLATADEGRRRDHVRDVLAVAGDALADGIEVRGLWWSTPIDPDGTGAAPPGLWDRERAPRPAAEVLAAAATGGPAPR